jgi:chaperonin cofactor prefoldin
MKKLEKLGFKKIPTEPGFTMYELSPATLELDEKLDKVEIEINETKHNLSSLEDRRKKLLEIINRMDSETN